MPPGLSDPPATATGHPWYPPPPGGYDEAHDPAGHPRPHWAPFFRALDDLGPAELARRWRAQPPPPLARRPAPHPRERRHLQRVRRPPRDRPPVAARPGPPGHR